MTISHATRHNLRDLSVSIPLKRFVCLTGVSGSGKTTLVREILLPALEANLKSENTDLESPLAKASDRMETTDPGDSENADSPQPAPRTTFTLSGHEHLSRVVLVDQSGLGKTPRSNPAVYIGAFDDIREVFAQSEAARQRGMNASTFSFNSSAGQCERCRGAGFEKIEMQFLSDVFIRCPDCGGRRYREHVLEVKLGSRGRESAESLKEHSSHRLAGAATAPEWSVADLLDATVEDAVAFLSSFAESKPAQRAVQSLRLLEEVGLGYLRLGQPINTLSGGESQRLKLVRHLSDSVAADVSRLTSEAEDEQSGLTSAATKGTLFLFDEPTTGLHFDDVRVLLKVFQRFVDAGHSVLVIEHNLEVIKCADWVIDLGPEAGDGGGRIVAQGTPEDIAACAGSHTGRALREVFHTHGS